MKLTSLASIQVANRQRREFPSGKLRELSDSIQRLGLLHPVVLRLVGEDYHLVCGGRRLRAIQELYDLGTPISHDGQPVLAGAIPYVLFDDLDPLAQMEAEYEENAKREDLTMAENAAAVLQLKTLRDAQAKARGEPPISVGDLTEELRGRRDGSFHEFTRQQLIIAQHLDDPEVAKATSVKDAFKTVLRKQEARKNTERAEVVGRTFSSALHRCHHADARRWLKEAHGEQFDLILTDPPYGMNAHQFGDSGGKSHGAHGYEDTYENFKSLMEVAVSQLTRVTKSQAHLYLFCDIENFFDLRGWFSEAGWDVFRTPLLWYSKTKQRAPWPDRGPQRKYELILFAVKGKKTVRKMAGDVLEFSSAGENDFDHSAQKPVGLFQELISRSCGPGESVLDFACGTGTIFPAAHALQVRATGVEMLDEYYGMATQRLEALK